MNESNFGVTLIVALISYPKQSKAKKKMFVLVNFPSPISGTTSLFGITTMSLEANLIIKSKKTSITNEKCMPMAKKKKRNICVLSLLTMELVIKKVPRSY